MTQQPYYETMYILRPDIPEEEVESHLTKYRDILVEAGADVLDNQMRGKRRLAYPIAKHKEGIYVQLSHNGPQSAVNNAKRVLKWKKEHGKEVKGNTSVGWTRANQLARKANLSRSTIARHLLKPQIIPQNHDGLV